MQLTEGSHSRIYIKTALLWLLQWCLLASAQYQTDASYGQQGKVRLHFDTFNEAVDVITPGGDTTLVLGNCSWVDTATFNTDVFVARLLPDGLTDTAFAGQGWLRYDFPGMDISTGKAILQTSVGDYFLLGTGYSFTNPAFHPFWVSRIRSTGCIDSTFGNHGSLPVQFAGLNETPTTLKVDQQGRLLLAGATTDTSDLHSEVPVLARMDANGRLDSSFGTAGKVYLRFPYGIIQDRDERHVIGGTINDLLVLADGRIIAAGGYSNSNNMVSFFVMLHQDGTVDSSFFSDGYLGLDLTALASNYAIKLIAANGKIFFGAKSDAIVSRDFYYGYLDELTQTYETDAIDFNQDEDEAKDMLLTTDGHLLLGGYSTLPQHNTSSYFSDFFSVAGITGNNYPYSSYHQTFSFANGFQSGINAFVEQSGEKLLCAGFVNTATGSDVALLRLIPQATDLQVIRHPSENFTLFPNPARHFVFVQTAGEGKYELFDLQGKKLKEFTASHSEMLDVSTLPAGLYWIRLGHVVKQLCVMR